MSLEAITPIDGRYEKTTSVLIPYFSERAFLRYRLIVEGEYLIALSEEKNIKVRKFTAIEKKKIRSLYNLTPQDAKKIKEFELVTNHDVKALEYFIKEKLGKTSLKNELEWVHFGLTSEDTNNLAYGLILSESMNNEIIPILEKVLFFLNVFAKEYRGLTMLARTHGQSASPTTLGKEFKVFASRLDRQMKLLKKHRVSVKLNGATGNYNAHVVAYPALNWKKFTVSFVRRLNDSRKINLEPNLITTQIEPHDSYAELFDNFRRINTILVDLTQDIWRYISDDLIVLKMKKGEIGSSTMPHKINPIDFEKSEGNLGIANSLFGYFSLKLPISRLQRDLSDSTVKRNFGVAFAHSLVAYTSILKGLANIRANDEKIADSLENHQEVIAEAIQTILRREGVKMPYESLKNLTSARKVRKEDFWKFIDTLTISEETKKELKKITPQNYIGIAKKLSY